MGPASFSILVVCTANICRSPAGQSLLSSHLSSHAVRIESAGTHALDGNAIDSRMARLLQQRGANDMAAHRSRPIMPTMLTRYDLVLCMEERHRQRVLELYPAGRGKVRLMGHWSTQQEIADPIGQSEAVYSAALDQLEGCTAQWARKLIDMGLTQ